MTLASRPRSLRSGAVSLLFAVVALSGCSAPDSPEVTNGDPVLEQGRDLFVRQCVSCHGPAGLGGRGPAVAGDLMVTKYPDIADQIALVSGGVNAMPAFGGRLEAAEIEAVVRYSREVLTSPG